MQSMQGRPRQSLTSCNECSTLLPMYERGLSTLLHNELHWLDVSARVMYKLGVIMYQCLHGQAPGYLADHLNPASKSLLVFIYAPSTNISSSFLTLDSVTTAVGLFRLRARRSETRYQTNSKIQRIVLIVLGSFLRQSFLAFTSVNSALEL